ncbi:hypothetical protein TNCV_3424211 [Trichonephila clavipes]|nr:hypothetical protein TNCV_3424211 [Trichonephila clavipes]
MQAYTCFLLRDFRQINVHHDALRRNGICSEQIMYFYVSNFVGHTTVASRFYAAVSSKAAISVVCQNVCVAPDVTVLSVRILDMLQTSLLLDSRPIKWLYDHARPN